MDSKKYDNLKKKIEKKSFEGKNESLSQWLYYFSFFGNIGSIFFAIFFVYPILYHAISLNLVDGKIGNILAVSGSLIILSMFELLKRKTVTNLSFDLIKNKYKINKTIWGLFFTLILLSSSFYFSINGAMEFVSTTDEFVETVENNINNEIDSVTNVYNNKIIPYNQEIDELRNVNSSLRLKILETPISYRSVRQGYQSNIDDNQELIDRNLNLIEEILDDKKKEIKILKEKNLTIVDNNINEDNRNILLFIIISTFIELIIIAGIFFKEYYDLYIYNQNKNRLEPIYQKRKRYKILLKFIYKDGLLTQGDQIIGAQKIKEVIREKSKLTNSSKFVDGFLDDAERLGIFERNGTRRVIKTDYDEAVRIIDEFDDSFVILDDLI
jgi:hypothetical protein